MSTENRISDKGSISDVEPGISLSHAVVCIKLGQVDAQISITQASKSFEVHQKVDTPTALRSMLCRSFTQTVTTFGIFKLTFNV
jgi:hypothetical protein